MKILIVDDKEENIYMLEALLKSNGYEVVSAGNGAEALEILKKESVNLIISDILMPIMDGFQLCREVKTNKNLALIPFIFYTASYTDNKDEEFALKIGAEKYIRKPLEPDDFINTIQSVISNMRDGKLLSPKLVSDEEEVMKLYNERLITKLEQKMIDLEKEIAERKKMEKEIKKRIKELEDFYNMAVDRELKMVELKEKIKELEEKLTECKKDNNTE